MLPLSEQIHNLKTILKTQELSTHIKQDLKKEIQRLKQELVKQEGIMVKNTIGLKEKS